MLREVFSALKTKNCLVQCSLDYADEIIAQNHMTWIVCWETSCSFVSLPVINEVAQQEIFLSESEQGHWNSSLIERLISLKIVRNDTSCWRKEWEQKLFISCSPSRLGSWLLVTSAQFSMYMFMKTILDIKPVFCVICIFFNENCILILYINSLATIEGEVERKCRQGRRRMKSSGWTT